MSLLFCGYYNNADGYKAAIDNFKYYFQNIIFFPYIKYIHKNEDKLIIDIETIIKNENIKYIIFWHNFDTIKNTQQYLNEILILKLKYNFKFININWDPNYNYNDIIQNKYFDLIYVSNPFHIKSDIYLPFYAGYDEKTSYYKLDKNYLCDVVFIGTNLYTDNFWENQTLNRKNILDEIIKNEDIKLHIYSLQNDKISQEYSKFHKGYIPYNECYLAFSNALFSLNISPLNNIENKGYYYYSERLGQILACNSIMISNNDFGNLLRPNIDYIHITDITKLNDIILEYKNSPKKCEQMRKNYKEKLNLFNYKHSLKDISEKIINL